MFDKTNGHNVVKFFVDYIQIHGVPRNIRLDQARYLIGNTVENYSEQNSINIITASANDHRPIGLLK